jgi:hypothetical protein
MKSQVKNLKWSNRVLRRTKFLQEKEISSLMKSKKKASEELNLIADQKFQLATLQIFQV